MGNYTYTEMTDLLKLSLGNRGDLESPTNWYQKWINDAYINLTTRRILVGLDKAYYWPQLEASTTLTLPDETAYLDVPDDLLVMRRVYNETDDTPLNYISAREYYSKTGKSDSTTYSNPTMYTRIGEKIYFYPTPDQDYSVTIYYRRRPERLSASGDKTAIGEEWDTIIVDIAKIYAHTHLQEFDFAASLREQVNNEIASIIGIYAQEEVASNKVIGVHENIRSGY